jgi:hypothetical protein
VTNCLSHGTALVLEFGFQPLFPLVVVISLAVLCCDVNIIVSLLAYAAALSNQKSCLVQVFCYLISFDLIFSSSKTVTVVFMWLFSFVNII